MGFDPVILAQVLDEYKSRRAYKRRQADRCLREVYQKLPRVAQIDQELRAGMLGVARAALDRGSDPGPVIASMRRQGELLEQERAAILRLNGYAEDCTRPTPDCARCDDTGYVGSSPCDCLLEAYGKAQKKHLSAVLDLAGQSFDAFDFELYSDRVDPESGMSPRQAIEKIYDICVDYARNFENRAYSLFLSGLPGRGKTFLSGCIAGEAYARGFSVVYDTAIHIFERLEAEHFGRDPSAAADAERYMRCDLLIIDDLGTEFSTQFTVSALYNLINTRLITRKKTIINSNFTNEELFSRYSPQIVSRLEGEYLTLYIIGEDLRQLVRYKKGI